MAEDISVLIGNLAILNGDITKYGQTEYGIVINDLPKKDTMFITGSRGQMIEVKSLINNDKRDITYGYQLMKHDEVKNSKLPESVKSSYENAYNNMFNKSKRVGFDIDDIISKQDNDIDFSL